jgi:hypothetical protein
MNRSTFGRHEKHAVAQLPVERPYVLLGEFVFKATNLSGFPQAPRSQLLPTGRQLSGQNSLSIRLPYRTAATE